MRCLCCNHHIWVEDSVKVQMGPVCRANRTFKTGVNAVEEIKANLFRKGIITLNWWEDTFR